VWPEMGTLEWLVTKQVSVARSTPICKLGLPFVPIKMNLDLYAGGDHLLVAPVYLHLVAKTGFTVASTMPLLSPGHLGDCLFQEESPWLL